MRILQISVESLAETPATLSLSLRLFRHVIPVNSICRVLALILWLLNLGQDVSDNICTSSCDFGPGSLASCAVFMMTMIDI